MIPEVQYDIDQIRAAAGSPAKALYSLWEALVRADRDVWLPDEEVIVDSWAFDSTMGNGINDLIANENYDVIANGLKSLAALDNHRVAEFVRTILQVFREHGIEATSAEGIARLELLPMELRSVLESELSGAERPFLNEIWHDGIIIAAATDRLERSLSTLRKRKPQNTPCEATGDNVSS